MLVLLFGVDQTPSNSNGRSEHILISQSDELVFYDLNKTRIEDVLLVIWPAITGQNASSPA